MSGLIPDPGRSQGFTLLELMTTITIVAVLLAIGVPSMRSMIQRNRVSSASNDLAASIAYARTTAINRGQLVSMCPSADGTSCTSAGQNFEPGWIVYSYPAGAASANKAYDSTATLLRAVDRRAGVSIYGLQSQVITFGLQGQLRPGTALAFLTCARSGDTGIGHSTATVHGVRMDVNGSGSTSTLNLAAGASCNS
ncbi:MAG: GspH/FimT family pseudopilin [Xanthomonadales bacterium]|nr:GspH/FimT family pseudopilin [Xanthomonadales bacterium]